LKEEMHVDGIFQLLDQLAELAPAGADGLLFTPWMYGERSPLNDQFVRSGLFNVGLNHTREHIIRAFFEGVAFNMRWAMETMENLYWKVEHLHAIGGGAKSRVWCQIIADVTNRVILQVEEPQLANAKGVALLASLTLGYIDKFTDIKNHIRVHERFEPDPHNRTVYDKQFAEFKALYKQNKRWYKRMNS
jgi:xylulokinase